VLFFRVGAVTTLGATSHQCSTLVLVLCVGAFTMMFCVGAFAIVLLFLCIVTIAQILVHTQRLFWKSNLKNALCWAFYCVNDNKENDLTIPQTMRFIFYYNSLILNLSSKTQAKKRVNHI
jgi:hypothetical protein